MNQLGVLVPKKKSKCSWVVFLSQNLRWKSKFLKIAILWCYHLVPKKFSGPASFAGVVKLYFHSNLGGGGIRSQLGWQDKSSGWLDSPQGPGPLQLKKFPARPPFEKGWREERPKKIPFEYQGGLIGNDCWWEKNSVGKNMDWILKMRGKTLKKSREPIVQKKSIIHIKIPRFPKYTFKIGDIWWNCEIGKNETHSWFWLVKSLLIGVLEQKQNPRISMTTEHRRKLLGVHWRRLESSQIFQEKFWMDP